MIDFEYDISNVICKQLAINLENQSKIDPTGPKKIKMWVKFLIFLIIFVGLFAILCEKSQKL